MSFIGQKSIIESFSDRIRHNSLSHAYALTAPVGSGKRTLARYLSKLFLCTNTIEAGSEGIIAPCGHCRSCIEFEADTNPNFTVIRNVTQKILIKQIRELIEDITVRPATGKKIYVIEEADRMTPDAQNCLLKTLEEPPGYAVIILTTSMYESLLITVRSRIVQVKMKPYSMDEMKSIVAAKGIDTRGREQLFAWSQGIPGKAIKLLGDKAFEENRQKVLSFVFSTGGFANLDINQYLSKNKECFAECMDILESVYRDALLVLCESNDMLINFDKQDNILEYAECYDSIAIADKIARIQEIRNNLKRNMNYQLAVDMATLVVEDR
jgi:DNA polymerase-3 subunit delta'